MSQPATRKPTASGFTVTPMEVHGVTLFVFDLREHTPEEGNPLMYVILRPTAEAAGLNEKYFTNLLLRTKLEKVKAGVKNIEFDPSVFESDRHRADADQTTSGRGGARTRTYQCLHIRKVERLLNEVDVARVKNPEAKKLLTLLQNEIQEVIEAYYHDGGAINEKATPTQKKTLRQKLDEVIEVNEELREENGDLRSDIKELVGLVRDQSQQISSQSKAIDGLVSTVGLMQEDISTLKVEVRDERVNRVAAVMRENKERYGRQTAEYANGLYVERMEKNGVPYRDLNKKIKVFAKTVKSSNK